MHGQKNIKGCLQSNSNTLNLRSSLKVRDQVSHPYETTNKFIVLCFLISIQCVPLATEPGLSLIILTPMKILQRNLNRSTFVVWEMKRNVSVVRVCSAPNCCDTEQRSASQPGSVASGTRCIFWIANWKTKDSAPNDCKHSVTSVCYEFLPE